MRVIGFLLSGICHQIPERSLHYQGQSLPLCARCAGVYVALPLGLFALWAIGQGRRSGFPPKRLWALIALLVAAWAADGLNSTMALLRGTPLVYEPSNLLRLITGAGLGLALAFVLYPIYHLALWDDGDHRPVLAERWSVLAPLATSALWVAVAMLWGGAPWAMMALLVTAGALGSLTMINGLLWALGLGLAGRYSSARRLGLAASLGALSALAELALLATARLLLIA